jgi:hypothetical protein
MARESPQRAEATAQGQHVLDGVLGQSGDSKTATEEPT